MSLTGGNKKDISKMYCDIVMDAVILERSQIQFVKIITNKLYFKVTLFFSRENWFQRKKWILTGNVCFDGNSWLWLENMVYGLRLAYIITFD